MKYYREKRYERVDPVTRKVLDCNPPFFWSSVTKSPDIATASLKLMNEAEDAGVSDGIGISLRGGIGELVGVGLARSASVQKKERDYRVLADVHLLSTYFHETYRAMILKPKQVQLTDRESGVLSWAAEGKTDNEIAMLLNISDDTVRFHWKKIFLKLGANGRIYAVTKAIRLQLISPLLIRTPYQSR
jgi:DNA-binding CsgD family transcriptional regulator